MDEQNTNGTPAPEQQGGDAMPAPEAPATGDQQEGGNDQEQQQAA